MADEFDPAGLARIDEIVAGAVHDGQVPGAVVGIARGEDIHISVAGAATVGGEPMRPDTLFRIASLTKPMTAAVVMSLVEDGRLRLDDPVADFLPELATPQVLRRPDGQLDDVEPARAPITARNLLTFTWGFGMQGAMFTAAEPWPIVLAAADLGTFGPPAPGQTLTADAWIARLGELPLIAPPDTTWLYSTGSQVLGVLCARVAGLPFEVLLRERLLEPLGMTDTAFWTSQTDRLATAYRRSGGELHVVDAPEGNWSRPPAFADGSAGLVSSVRDVVAFGRMLVRGGAGVLRPTSVAEMVRDQLTADQRRNDWDGFDILDGRGWGFGLSVLQDRHSWDGGSGCSWSNIASLDLTVVTLTQRQFDEHGPAPIFDDVLQAAREAAIG